MAATISNRSWKGPTPFGSGAVGLDCGAPDPAGSSGLSGAVCASSGFSNRWSFHLHYDDFSDAYDDFGGSSRSDPAAYSDYDDVVTSTLSRSNIDDAMGDAACVATATTTRTSTSGEMEGDSSNTTDDDWLVEIVDEDESLTSSRRAFDLSAFELLVSGGSDSPLEGDFDVSSNPLMSSSTQWLAQGLSVPSAASRKKTASAPANYKTAAEKYLDNDKAGKTNGSTLCRQWEDEDEDWGAMGSVGSFGTTSSRLSAEPERGSVVTDAISTETKEQLDKLQKNGSILDMDKKRHRKVPFSDDSICHNALELAGCFTRSSSHNKLLSGLSQLPTTLDGEDERLEEVIRQRKLGREALAMAIGTILARAAVHPSTNMSEDNQDDGECRSVRIILPSCRGTKVDGSDVTVGVDEDGDEGMYYDDDPIFQHNAPLRETSDSVNADAMMSIDVPRNAWTWSSLQHWWTSTSNSYNFGSGENESPVRCWTIRLVSTKRTQQSKKQRQSQGKVPGCFSENDSDMSEAGGTDESNDTCDSLIERMALAIAKFLLSAKERSNDNSQQSNIGYDTNMDEVEVHPMADGEDLGNQAKRNLSRADRTPPLQFFQESGGLMLLVMSLVESRGFSRIRSDMDDPTTSKLLTRSGDASAELVKLVSSGRATTPPSASLSRVPFAVENDQMEDTVPSLVASDKTKLVASTSMPVFGSGLRVNNRRSFSSLEESSGDGVDAEELRQRPWMASLVNCALRPTKRARVVGVHPNHFSNGMLPQPLGVPATPNLIPGHHPVRAS